MVLRKGKIAILTPKEFEQLRKAVTRRKLRILLEVALYTGMRYVELQRFSQNTHWFDEDRNCIVLPDWADRKTKRVSKGRYVHLSDAGLKVISHYIDHYSDDERPVFPSLPAWDGNLKKWAEKARIDTKDCVISAKTTRKTWECWLVISYPDRIPLICMNQGHTDMVAMRHYLNLGFTPEERREIKRHTSGWMEHF